MANIQGVSAVSIFDINAYSVYAGGVVLFDKDGLEAKRPQKVEEKEELEVKEPKKETKKAAKKQAVKTIKTIRKPRKVVKKSK